MMFLKSSHGLANRLTTLCQDFFLGFNYTGGKKIPLVAWETIARTKVWTKVDGSLGFKDFKSHSDALLVNGSPGL